MAKYDQLMHQQEKKVSPVQMTYGQVEPSTPVAHLKKRLELCTNQYEFNQVECNPFQTEAIIRMMMVAII